SDVCSSDLARGEPRRPHPRRLPEHAAGVAAQAAGVLHRGRAVHHGRGEDPALDAGRPDHPVRPGRAEQVPHRRRDGRVRQDREMSYKAKFRVWRGEGGEGKLEDFTVEVNEGEVVLDILHRLQATQAPDLAVRWNCKAGKCGSCSMEINGKPRLGCMTRMSTFSEDETITVTPMRTFPVIKDLVCDVSFNYEKAREVPSFTPP